MPLRAAASDRAKAAHRGFVQVRTQRLCLAAAVEAVAAEELPLPMQLSWRVHAEAPALRGALRREGELFEHCGIRGVLGDVAVFHLPGLGELVEVGLHIDDADLDLRGAQRGAGNLHVPLVDVPTRDGIPQFWSRYLQDRQLRRRESIDIGEIVIAESCADLDQASHRVARDDKVQLTAAKDVHGLGDSLMQVRELGVGQGEERDNAKQLDQWAADDQHAAGAPVRQRQRLGVGDHVLHPPGGEDGEHHLVDVEDEA
mmetsp:Transcript_101580/g.292638  ORF Transcript_101580/g.292638 Transcript_101580/m.292638 type:complete len:257 (-) Transcript_101580:1045-1815(-)